MNRISVIVPTFNEEKNIDILIQEIRRAGQIHGLVAPNFTPEIIVVDDGNDHTTEIALGYGVVVLEGRKAGLGAAIIQGISAASHDIIVVMDADLSHNPHAIPGLIRPIVEGNAEFVIGSRYVPGGSTGNWSRSRVLQSQIGTRIMKLVTGVADANSGFFALHRSVIEGVELRPDSWKIMLEILYKGHWTTKLELPIQFSDRRHGTSKAKFSHKIQHSKHLIRLILGNISLTSNRSSEEPDYEWLSFFRGKPWQRWWKQRLAKAIMDLLPDPGYLLDIGSGSSPNGMLTGPSSYCALDADQGKLDYLAWKCQDKIRCVQASAENLYDLGEEVFDSVLMAEVIEHFPDRLFTRRVLRGISQVVKMGGVVIITTPDFGSLLGKIQDSLYKVFHPQAYGDEHVNQLSETELVNIPAGVGLIVEDVRRLYGLGLVVRYRRRW